MAQGDPSLGSVVFGKSSDFGFWKRLFYRFASAKFPDWESCVSSAEDGKIHIKWSDIRSGKQLEVCIFNIATAQNSRVAALDWFRQAGLSVRIKDVTYRENGTTYNQDIVRRYLILDVPQLTQNHPFLFIAHKLLKSRRVIFLDFEQSQRIRYIKQEISTL